MSADLVQGVLFAKLLLFQKVVSTSHVSEAHSLLGFVAGPPRLRVVPVRTIQIRLDSRSLLLADSAASVRFEELRRVHRIEAALHGSNPEV